MWTEIFLFYFPPIILVFLFALYEKRRRQIIKNDIIFHQIYRYANISFLPIKKKNGFLKHTPLQISINTSYIFFISLTLSFPWFYFLGQKYIIITYRFFPVKIIAFFATFNINQVPIILICICGFCDISLFCWVS